MDFTKMKKERLLEARVEIENQIKYLNDIKAESNKLRYKNRLSDLEKGDKIFCIHIGKNGHYDMDFVKISFSKTNEPYTVTQFSTKHDTQPLNCGGYVEDECMGSHCFIADFCSSYYFCTLKPYSWKKDFELEIQRLIGFKQRRFDADIVIINNNVTALLNVEGLSDCVGNYL